MVDGSTRSQFQPFQMRVGVLVLVISIVLTVVHPTLACPFCLSPPQTLSEQISRADVVVIAELVQFRIFDFGNRAESTLRIREIVRGRHFASRRKELVPGQCITVNGDFSAQRGDLFLMYGELADTGPVPASSTFAQDDAAENSSDSGDRVTQASLQTRTAFSAFIEKMTFLVPELISWNETTAISPAMVRYIRQLPGNAVPPSLRLEYFMKCLEHPDPLIAIDAWAEFGNATYDDVAAVSHCMSRESLRKWIADPMMSPERLGLYGMMLGLCGNSDDAEFLQQQLGDPLGADFRFGADGLMAGYLMLAGERGLSYLEETRVEPANVPATSSHSVVQALQFMWSYECDIIPQQRVRESMRLFLKHESMREIVIANLSRWEDWASLPILLTLFDGECSDDRLTQRAILQFAQVCAKSAPATAAPPAHAIAAAEFLARVQATQPDLLTTSDREFGPPQQTE
ncbi:MAG: hypothetical protein H7Z17_04615 [Fuerstia sp.]|nr:hypothetical protein [Fuerstiella sp.]